MKINAESLRKIGAAESMLRKGEIDEMVESVPQGHPLLTDIARVKAELGGDLSGLPEGHPLFVELRRAKERFEGVGEAAPPEQEEGGSAKPQQKLRKAKRLDHAAAKRQQRAESERRDASYRDAVSAVNAEIDLVMAGIRRLYGLVSTYEGVFAGDPLGKVKMARLVRFLSAAERGFSDGKMSKVRHG